MKISSILVDLQLDNEDDYLLFKGYVSECDAFPMGKQRNHWDKEALEKLDLKKNDFENHHKKDLLEVCNLLIRNFSD